MISEKLLGLVGETEKLDELKAIMDEMDVIEAKNTELTGQIEALQTHISELNDVNAKLLLSSVAAVKEDEKENEKSIDDMTEDEFFEYLGEKTKGE